MRATFVVETRRRSAFIAVTAVILALAWLLQSGAAAQAVGGPTVTIGNLTKVEGSINNSFAFTITLSTTSASNVVVTYHTTDGTAKANADYRATSSTVTILAGRRTVGIPVMVYGDTANEPNQTFTVTLDSATNATVGSPNVATGTIQNDDTGPVCTIEGTIGTDLLVGTGGDDVLCGLAGNDNLRGAGGSDALLGGDGNDVLVPDAGNDSMDGGPGVDTVNYVVITTGGVTVDLAGGTSTTPSGSGAITAVENATGTQQGDTLIGDGQGNVLTGLGGDDTLTGNLGNDTLYPGLGADTVNGGGDIDTVTYQGSTVNNVTIDLAAGQATGPAAGGTDGLSGIENASGTTNGADTLVGTGTANVLNGVGGTDICVGSGGGDTFLSCESFNRAPVARNDPAAGAEASFATDQDTSITTGNVLTNDSDDAGETISVVSMNTTGTVGQVTNNANGTFGYNPNGQFASLALGATTTDTFTYTIQDGGALQSTATVTITVTGLNDAPTITKPAAKTVNEDTSLNFTGVSIADVDAGGSSVTVTLGVSNGTLSFTDTTGVTGNGTGSVSISGTVSAVNTVLGTMSYQGASNYNGADTLTVGVNDNVSGGAKTASDTVGITVSPVNDAPVIAAKSYSARPNLHLAITNSTNQGGGSSTGNLLNGASDPDAVDAGFTPAFTASLVTGSVSPSTATVLVSTNGDFDFDAAPGYSGDVTFTYRVTDNGRPDTASSDATVTIHVTGTVVWFINNSVVTNGNGTSASPFKTVADYEAVRGQVTPVSPIATGSVIYIEHNTGVNYTGPLTLLDNQQLIGEGATGGSFETVTGATAPPAGSAVYPTLNAANVPILTSASGTTLTLAANNTVNGVAVQGTGAANVVRSTIAASGTVIFTSAPITQSGSGMVVNITSRTGGTVTFAASSPIVASAASNAGISLSGNANTTFAFNGALTLGQTTPSATSSSFSASGGGTVANSSSVVNTINAVNTVALNVSNTNIGAGGLTFQSIAANGGTNGIVLSNTGTTAGLTVTGTGSAGSGGTIQNTTNRGASFVTTGAISLSAMNFTNATTTNGSGCADIVSSSNAACNAPIHLDTVTAATLSTISISGSAQNGLNGRNVTNLVMSSVTISGAGNEPDESGINIQNVLGTSSMTAVTVSGSGDDNVRIQNISGAASTLTISNGSFTGALDGSGLLLGVSGTGNLTTTVTGSTFSGNFSAGIAADGSAGTMVIKVSTSTITNNNDAISIGQSNSGTVRYEISNNTGIDGHASNGITAHMGSSSTAGSTMTGFIDNNSITVPDGNSANGIEVFASGSGTHTSRVNGNTVSYGGVQYGIYVTAQEGGGTLNATVTSNTVTATNAGVIYGLNVNAGALDDPADTNRINLDLRGNTVSGAAENIVVTAEFNTRIDLFKSTASGATPLAVLQQNNPATNAASVVVHLNTIPGSAATINLVASAPAGP